MLLGTLILLACEINSPAPLPPSVHLSATSTGRMVQHGQVTGYIAMHRTQVKANGEGVITLVDTIDDEAKRAAENRAQKGVTVLAIEPHTDIGESKSYLMGFSGIERVIVDCLRGKQPKNAIANTDHLNSCPYHP
jgi:hypothetical protein